MPIKRILSLLAVFAGPAIGALFLGYIVFDRPIWEMDINGVVEFYRGLGIWAVVLSLGLNILQTFVVFMPSVFLSGANAVVFGLFWGTVISWLGEVIGATAAFILYRYFSRGVVQEFRNRRDYLKKIDEISSGRGFWIVLVLRFLPAMPSGIVNILGALSKISFMSFIMATAIGKLPSLVLETMIGHDLFFWEENWGRLLTMIIISLLVYAVYRFTGKKGGE